MKTSSTSSSYHLRGSTFFYTFHYKYAKKLFFRTEVFYTDAFTYKHFYTQRLLHADTFTHTHTSLCTQTLLHTDAFNTLPLLATIWHADALTQQSLHREGTRIQEHTTKHATKPYSMPPRGHKNRCFTTIFVARTFLVQNLLQNLKFGAKAEKRTILKLYKRNFKRKMESAKNGKNHQNLLQNQIYFGAKAGKKVWFRSFLKRNFERKMESAKNGKNHPKPAPKPGFGAKAEKSMILKFV